MDKSHLSDVAQMQRRRLQKVIDPVKYTVALGSIGHLNSRLADYHSGVEHQIWKQECLSLGSLCLVLSGVPLAYAS